MTPYQQQRLTPGAKRMVGDMKIRNFAQSTIDRDGDSAPT
jgi:hypothetical protein